MWKLGLGTGQEGRQVRKLVLWRMKREQPTGSRQEISVGVGNKMARGEGGAERSVWRQFKDIHTSHLP